MYKKEYMSFRCYSVVVKDSAVVYPACYIFRGKLEEVGRTIKQIVSIAIYSGMRPRIHQRINESTQACNLLLFYFPVSLLLKK